MDILIKPLITEKMTGITEKMNRYGFIVNKKANKIQIKNAIEKMYGVKVETVNTMIYPIRTTSRSREGKVSFGKFSSYKKAIVSVAKNELIDFYSNI